MENLLKLYYSCVIPALLYGCETWILNSHEIKHLNRIQINTLQKILTLCIATAIPVIYRKIKQMMYSEYKVMNTKQIQGQ